jgi:N-acetylmuramoyl-L-alanine amidase
MSKLHWLANGLALSCIGALAGCPPPARVVDPLPEPPMGVVAAANAPRPVVSLPPAPEPHPWPSYRPSPTPPAPPPVPTPRPVPAHSVVLDAGHGGRDPGAIGVNGLYEKVVNLSVTVEVAHLLQQRGVRVTMTRTTDRYLTLEQRAAIANRVRPNLFVSIHADSAPNRTARGFTLYVANGASSRSHAAADAIVRTMATTGMHSRKKKKKNIRVLVQTRCPAVLVELGFLSNRQDAALLASAAFRSRLARAVARGICAHLGTPWDSS